MPEEPVQEVVAEQPVVETPPPTPEQIQAELKAAQDKIKELQKGLQTAGQTIKERTNALNNLDSLKAEVNLLRDSIKEIYTTKLERDEATGDIKLNMPKQDITGKLNAISEQAKVMAEINARKERVEALGLDPDSEEYLEIKDLVTRMNFGLADKKLSRIEAAKKPPVSEAPKESDEARIERLVQERLRKEMEKANLLIPEGGNPSASSGTYSVLVKRYADGEITTKEYQDTLRKLGKS